MEHPLGSHQDGHAFLHNGDLYYSPNSSRKFSVPQEIYIQNSPFKPASDHYADYTQTSWLLMGLSYLAFVPSTPIFSGPLSCLQDSEFRVSELPNKRFGLSLQSLDQWCKLEKQLLTLITFFQDHDHPKLVICPPLPSSLGFSESNFSYTVTLEQIRRSRDWFLLWIAVVAFLMARKEDPSNSSPPPWFFEFINENKTLSQSWLSDFRSHILHTLTARPVPLIGSLTNPFKPESCVPPIRWFFKWKIPVWYRWSMKEMKAIRLDEFKKILYVEPPPYILQSATTFLEHAPSLPRDEVAPSPTPI